MPRFSCSSCGTDGALVGVISRDASGRTPCPVCRTPVLVLDGPAPDKSPQPESLADLLFVAAFLGAFALVFLGVWQAILWYVFGVDVVAWGGVTLFGLRVPYFYLVAPALAVFTFVTQFIGNEQLKARVRKNG